MEIVRRNYPDLPPTRAPHFQSVRVGTLLFLSGATARDTEAAYGDMAAQRRKSLLGADVPWA